MGASPASLVGSWQRGFPVFRRRSRCEPCARHAASSRRSCALHSPSPSTSIPALSISRCRRPSGRREWMLTLAVFRRHGSVQQSGTSQSGPARCNGLCTKPVVWRSAMPNNLFIVRQVRMAASLSSGCRPRLPVGAASHVMAGSNRIVSKSRRFSALLRAGQVRVLQTGAWVCSCSPALTLDSRDESSQPIHAAEPHKTAIRARGPASIQGFQRRKFAIRRRPTAWDFSGWNWVPTILSRPTTAVTGPP